MWKSVKKQRVRLYGAACEVCNSQLAPKHLVLHHIKNRCHGGADTLANSQLRCVPCEIYLHARYRDGNAPREKGNEEGTA